MIQIGLTLASLYGAKAYEALTAKLGLLSCRLSRGRL